MQETIVHCWRHAGITKRQVAALPATPAPPAAPAQLESAIDDLQHAISDAQDRVGRAAVAQNRFITSSMFSHAHVHQSTKQPLLDFMSARAYVDQVEGEVCEPEDTEEAIINDLIRATSGDHPDAAHRSEEDDESDDEPEPPFPTAQQAVDALRLLTRFVEGMDGAAASLRNLYSLGEEIEVHRRTHSVQSRITSFFQ